MKRIFIFLALLFGAHNTLAAAPTIVALPANDNAAVAIELRFHAGAVDDPQGKAGLTFLTATLMAEGGTEALDSRQLLGALFPMATEVHVTVDKELTTFRTIVHRDHLEKMVKILTDVVAHPRWDEKEFARLKEDVINDVEKRLRQGDDENLGKEAMSEAIFAKHPYGRLSEGHLADLRSLTLKDLRSQAARIFTLDRLQIGVAGGYPVTLTQQLQTALAGLPKKGAPLVKIPVAAKPHERVTLVDKDTESSAVSIGMPWTLSRKDPDFAAMSVARSAFGEHRQFNGRLMQRLREARGLNYGDYAYLEHFQQEGGDAATAQTGRARHQQYFSIWLRPVQNENRLFAVRAALYELDRSLTVEPFSDAEVAATKGFLDGYILLYAQTDARKLGYAMDDKFIGADHFLANLRAQLATVTTAQVNKAWRKWVDPKKLEIIMVTPRTAEVKAAMVANMPSPMHYQKDAAGHTAVKPAELLKTDALVEKFPFGVKSAADVKIIPVTQIFE